MAIRRIHGKGGGYVALTVTSILWGTTWVASKIAIAEIPALQMAAYRQLIAGLVLIAFFHWYKKMRWPTFAQFKWLTLLSILMFVLANGFSTWSLNFIPAGMSALIGALYPLSVVIIERIFFRSKKINILTLLGFFLGISGVAIVFYENAFHISSASFVAGIALSLTAMLAWSLGTVFIVRNKANLNPYYAVGWQMLISSVILYFVSELSQPVIPLREVSFKVWMVILYLVVFGSIVSFVAFIYSMKKLPAAIASLYAYFNPLVAMLLAALILDEKLTLNILWGAIVTLIGVYLVNYSIKRREKIIAEAEQ
jgi:drug/metabolite transporter (DMT)-like permease